MGRVEINTRVINKHDTEANWNSHPSFIPDKSEIIVYDKDDNYNYPRVKIGDGVTNIVSLPFIDAASIAKAKAYTEEYVTNAITNGNANSAKKLATARTVDGVSFNGTANITHYGTCSTAAGTAAKTVSLTGFTLATGAEISVKFTVTNTASNPTLNVNNTGAKAIYYRGAAISAGYLAAKRIYKFIYDGTNYELIGDINTDANTDTKVTNTLATTTKAYVTGTTSASTNTGTQVFDTGVYLDTTAGQLTATTFKGALSGNAATATKLATARTISLTGSVTGSGSFDGSGNLSIATTTNHTHNYAGSSSAGGIATNSYSLANKGTLNTQEKIDSFLAANILQYATFKTSDDNNVGMASNGGMILSIPWISATYGAQIAFDDAVSGLVKIRGKSTNWGDWYTLLHSGNYTTYTVTKTGSGASGTWGINISGTAAKATQDSAGQQINTTYIKGLSVSGKTITYTKGDGTTGTITTQDTNTDTKVTQTVTTSNASYPLLLAPSGQTATTTTTSYFDSGVTLNPSTNTIVANVSGNAATATKLATARNINGMSVQGDANRFNYGSCSTAASTAAKVVDCAGFVLATGSEITIKFTVTNTAANPTLNVNSTGAKAIYYRGAAISAGYLAANRTYIFRYNGTQYDLVGDLNTNTASTTGTSNKTGTKLFLAGATSQATAPTTYSNSSVYIGTDNCLYSNGSKVATASSVSAVSKLVGDTPVSTQITSAINDAGFLSIDLNNAESGLTPFTNSDMLGGLPASSYLQVADFPQALTDARVVKSVAGKTPNASGEIALVPADIGAVPTSRTVNGKALSSNISLTYSDVGAAAGSHTHSNYVTKAMFSLSGTTLTITTT